MTTLEKAQTAIKVAETAIISAEMGALDVGRMALAQTKAQLAVLKAHVAVLEIQATQAAELIKQSTQSIEAYMLVVKTITQDAGEVDVDTLALMLGSMLAPIVQDVALRYAALAPTTE